MCTSGTKQVQLEIEKLESFTYPQYNIHLEFEKIDAWTCKHHQQMTQKEKQSEVDELNHPLTKTTNTYQQHRKSHNWRLMSWSPSHKSEAKTCHCMLESLDSNKML